MRILFCVLSLATLLLAAPATAGAALVPHERAGATPSPFGEVQAKIVMVADAATGVELLSRGADTVWPLASLTKLLSAITVLEKKPNLGKIITMQRGDEVGGARLRNVRPGLRFRTKDLLAASIIGSTNNTAAALARAWGPGVQAFVSKMNQTAKRLGLSKTVVRDPTGLDPRNLSTARELAVLIRKAYAQPQIFSFLTSATYIIAPVGKGAHRTIQNTNKLVSSDPGYRVAGKTGFINESGYNFAALVDDDTSRALVIVLLGNTSQERNFVDTRIIAEWVWGNFEWSTGG